jgi:hypothetical protein
MNRPLFLRIVDGLSNWSPYFTQRVDAIGRQGISPLQQCTAAIRMLAYGTSANQLDEVLKIAASTCLDILGKFTEGIIEIFGDEYLRPPKSGELEQILKENEDRGFPGCTGSLDCCHWPWKNCPKGWSGQFTSGKEGFSKQWHRRIFEYDMLSLVPPGLKMTSKTSHHFSLKQ